ncbi:MAG: response regulator [Chloroflexota bacterium]
MTTEAPAALRVLLVEDEMVNRELIGAVLRSGMSGPLGALELIEASTLAAGRAAVAEHAPDLIILDVRLPDGDGLELARELPEAGTRGRPNVLVMSASVLPADIDAARRSGGDAFLGKPFQPAELIAVLARLAGSARSGGSRSASAAER